MSKKEPSTFSKAVNTLTEYFRRCNRCLGWRRYKTSCSTKNNKLNHHAQKTII
uniref:Uncharacterized protein n=1 Tax=Nelumbo nucifera TaxID=4432 RepID=A0A822YK76_NELNU|nr:TPA_asm: hypothetical protein HUJ06_010560 [Nelumbo nucifera]